jgi:hypothetical protein
MSSPVAAVLETGTPLTLVFFFLLNGFGLGVGVAMNDLLRAVAAEIIGDGRTGSAVWQSFVQLLLMVSLTASGAYIIYHASRKIQGVVATVREAVT